PTYPPGSFFCLVVLRNNPHVHGSLLLPRYVPHSAAKVLRGVAAALQVTPRYFDMVFDIRTYGPQSDLVLGSMRLMAVAARHNTETNALRIDMESGGTLVFSSDTGWFPELAELARTADVLLIEATDRTMPDHNGPRWHLCPRDIARVVTAGRPLQTVLTHYVGDHAGEILAEVAEACPFQAIDIAMEGKTYDV
ncbi:MAG: MBL fold metallo-hydrolase, partial [Jatrophihabitans sp.]